MERYTHEQVKEKLEALVEEADADIISEIRSQPEFRDNLLAELDVLERIRGRLYAAFG